VKCGISNLSSLFEIVTARAAADPTLELYSFVSEKRKEAISTAQLMRRSQAVGGYLQKLELAGRPVIVLCGPGLAPIYSFFGCIFAGAIAVPLPMPGRRGGNARLKAVLHDCGAGAIIGTNDEDGLFADDLADVPPVSCLTIEDIGEDHASDWRNPVLDGSSIAFIQYTSGSTGAPKGVIVSHDNLLNNANEMHEVFAISTGDRGVSWLPFYHDMGLIGGAIQPVYSGYSTRILSAVSFIEQPTRWLQAISQTRATISGGPNFAYDLCVQKFARDNATTLDLSSWRVAFNGSETVRPETLQKFAATFADYGFNPKALRPCYGLAEATLLVSARNCSIESTIHIDAEAFKQGRVQEAPAGSTGSKLLSAVGEPNPSHTVRIVNPAHCQPCDEAEIGEIWISGPSVAKGYWKKRKETNQTFYASLDDDGHTYLRTGDLGFLRRGQLFITGRLKDLIIVRGQNFYPQDIEATVRSCHISLQAGRGAAFSIDIDEEERLVVVHEVARKVRQEDVNEILRQIWDQIACEHQLIPYAIVLVRHGSIPKTTSGKVQHGACRDAFLADSLKEVARADGPNIRLDLSLVSLNRNGRQNQQLVQHPAPEYSKLIFALAGALQIDPALLVPDLQLTTLGLDSLKAAQIKVAIERSTGVDVPFSRLLSGPSIRELSEFVQDHSQRYTLSLPRDPSLRHATVYPLSAGQKALWFLQQVEPESSAYTIARVFKVHGLLDATVLRAAFDLIIQRHPSLHMTVVAGEDGPLQDLSRGNGCAFTIVEARDWDEVSLETRMRAAANAGFDLTRGPVLRVQVYIRSDAEATMLLCAHHIALDLWSLSIVAEELSIVYQSLKSGKDANLTPPLNEYAAFVEWQSELLASPRGEQLVDYWRGQLANMPKPLALPVGRQMPAQGGSTSHFDIDTGVADQLRSLGRNQHVTLHSLLFAAFEVLLHRYTGQEGFLTGMLSSGRNMKCSEGVVGYFVNPIVLRSDFSQDLSFTEYLQRSHRTVLEALDHGDLPFSVLVEQLHSSLLASRAPLFRVLCIFQPSHISNGPDLLPFIMGKAGGEIQIGDLLLESEEFVESGTQCDLTLMAGGNDKQISVAFKYDCACFDAGFIERLARHYQVLLARLAEEIALPIRSLSMLTQAELTQIISLFNDTESFLRNDVYIHTLFEEQVDRTPNNIALVYEEQELTYRELDCCTNRLANYLRSFGVGAEAKAGLFLERSLDIVVGLLGILKAGCAYVALDPSHPIERTRSILRSSQAAFVITTQYLAAEAGFDDNVHAICLDQAAEEISKSSHERVANELTQESLAYVMHTSGSTGSPKGVMVEHRNIANFVHAMDKKVPCNSEDVFLAVTSISFDISVLELLWTLTRGCKVIIANDPSLNSATFRKKSSRKRAKDLQFSLFYFASSETEGASSRYQMLLEGAKLADELALDAVWTPERHFHAFGGLYSNPSLTSAALAMVTRHVQLRAGSVVLPLHNPVRVAEEWSFVDNISQGRVGVAFASGWHADDFVFAPESYASRKEVMYRGIETVRQLWRGSSVKVRGGSGDDIEVKIYPQPVQTDLPVWITSAGNADTFEAAARIHANVLTHLLGQELTDVAGKIEIYRQGSMRAGRDSDAGIVTLMLHTYLDHDPSKIRKKALAPFKQYLRSSLGLVVNLIRSLKLDLDPNKMKEKDLDDLLIFAAERYMGTSGLFGDPKACLAMVDAVRSAGVDEVACLLDFGIDFASTMQSIRHIQELKSRFNRPVKVSHDFRGPQGLPSGATMLQCTPSFMRMLMSGQASTRVLGSLRMLLLGGEALPAPLIGEVRKTYKGPILNMYGPTETTVWSAVQPVSDSEAKVLIGGPIANTQIYVLDAEVNPVPIGIAGEIYIGGNGLARGYLGDPGLTAERFIPSPFAGTSGMRLYRTGDLGRLQSDGRIELLGRVDHQVKIRGHRIELGDIEFSLNKAPGVSTGVVIKQGEVAGEEKLVAYFTSNKEVDLNQVRGFLRKQLPPFMVPDEFHVINEFPLTANGKIDRRVLLKARALETAITNQGAPPSPGLQATVLGVWKSILKADSISIDDNFFDIGGHSLLMVQVHERLQLILQKQFPLMALLQHPTVRTIAEFLESSNGSHTNSTSERVARQREGLVSQRNRTLALRTELQEY
jgi:natural product biosynthesis luciferase-like monooxygenase protein